MPSCSSSSSLMFALHFALYKKASIDLSIQSIHSRGALPKLLINLQHNILPASLVLTFSQCRRDGVYLRLCYYSRSHSSDRRRSRKGNGLGKINCSLWREILPMSESSDSAWNILRWTSCLLGYPAKIFWLFTSLWQEIFRFQTGRKIFGSFQICPPNFTGPVSPQHYLSRRPLDKKTDRRSLSLSLPLRRAGYGFSSSYPAVASPPTRSIFICGDSEKKRRPSRQKNIVKRRRIPPRATIR